MGYENSGRRPAATDLKLLRGNPGKRKPNENEVRPPAGDPVKPVGLSAGASLMWDELAPICIAMRTLTPADVRAFTGLCELQFTMAFASASKDERALLDLRPKDPKNPDGPLTVSIDAVLKLERETANALRPYYEYFGLTPSARARLSVPAQDAAPSKWAGALK